MSPMATTTVDELYAKALETLNPSEVQELVQRLQDSVDEPELTDEEREFLEMRLEKARRDSAAGRVIPHAKVVTWLDSLGTDNELDPPTWK